MEVTIPASGLDQYRKLPENGTVSLIGVGGEKWIEVQLCRTKKPWFESKQQPMMTGLFSGGVKGTHVSLSSEGQNLAELAWLVILINLLSLTVFHCVARTPGVKVTGDGTPLFLVL